jgi:hypothetical protein
MTITYPLNVPARAAISSTAFRMVDVIGVNQSPYTLSVETQEHAGKRWEVDVSLIPMIQPQANDWIAFLASLRGQYGTFLLGDVINRNPAGAATGTPLVKGANQKGASILIDGCTPNVANWLKAGDWVQFGTGMNSRLHRCLTNVDSNSSGEVTLDLWPGPRTFLADNQDVIVRNTVGVWRLAGNDRGYSQSSGQIYTMNFSAIEAL